MSMPLRKSGAKWALDELIRDTAPISNPCHPYWRLINSIRASSQFLSPATCYGIRGLESAQSVLRACLRMGSRFGLWQHEPESWDAPDGGQFIQFQSLVSHLFDQFRVPTFMGPVWRKADCKKWEIRLYLHLAEGKSVRQFDWPAGDDARMTKSAARWFMCAPDDLSPSKAYRWAHVRSLGGDVRLARILAMTPELGMLTKSERFWEGVIRFLVQYLPIEKSEIEAIVRFIHQQRFQTAASVLGRWAGNQPIQPNFTIGGRSLMSLRRHMTNWREERLKEIPVCQESPKWKRADIAPFRQMAGESIWTIDELLSDRELRVEGSIMQHCVATYIRECARRKTTIWSMKIQQGERRRRELTIEVNPESRTILQAKGKRNAIPSSTAVRVLREWAEQERLKLGYQDE
ncbi:MAG: PcfJ domain-containing protein [Planctomycetota bacterium]